MKKAFKRGLLKAAESTKSYIITNGFYAGASKLVSEALSENSHQSQLTSIGIMSLSVISSYAKVFEVTFIFVEKVENSKQRVSGFFFIIKERE
jgi:hypothetical protein